jgi:hypothetical protein
MFYDADALRCLQAALPLGRYGAEVVASCDRLRPYDSEALACVRSFL